MRDLEAEQRQLRYEKTRPLQEAIERLGQEIERNEQRKTDIEAIMADPAFYRDGERVKEVTAEYRSLQISLNDQYHRWNDLDKELQRVQEEFQLPLKP
jgi:protein subunit release factor A